MARKKEEMLELELEIARAIAQDMVKSGLDLNEVGKVLAYLRAEKNWPRALRLMKRLARTGAVRSNRTRRYYEIIYGIARGLGTKVKADRAGRILGWAVRLARLPSQEKRERSKR